MHPDRNNPGTHGKKVCVIAGEASGDLHGANLVRTMEEMGQDLRFSGIGGTKMKQAGVELLAGSGDMAVVGLTEVLSRLGVILQVRKKIRKHLKEERPDLLILIDYPDFNIPLAKYAKKLGIPVLYYISPQVWAWRQGRISVLERSVDRMAVILPFEKEFYGRVSKLDVHFTGHPLLDVVKQTAPREQTLTRRGLNPGRMTVALLPGSREKEVTRLLPEMLTAAGIIAGKLPDIQFLLPLADTLSREFVSAVIAGSPIPVTIVENDGYNALAAADAAMVTSGTATLETALLEVPMIIVYKVSPLSYLLGRMVIHVSHIGLVNIIAGREIVPELIQGYATGEAMADEIYRILSDQARRRQMREDLKKVRTKLGSPGASRRAAELALEMIG